MKAPWNFSDSRRTNLSLDDFLAAKEAAGVAFFTGKEPWMKGVNNLTWQTFFRVCTQEMDDLSEKAVKHVTEYCLEILQEVEAKIPRKTFAQKFKTLKRKFTRRLGEGGKFSHCRFNTTAQNSDQKVTQINSQSHTKSYSPGQLDYPS
jgi:hypothetical protein